MTHPIYEELTRRIIEALEHGHIPWIRPWNTWPVRHNGRRFTGTNSLILCLAADEAGYRSRYWLTWSQGKRFGGRVPRGCKGTRVLRPLIAPLPAAALDPAVGLLPPGTRRVWKTRDGTPVRMRAERYQVFNAEQFEGLRPRFYRLPEPEEPNFERADQFFRAIRARIEEGGDKASYSPTRDLIRMPRSVWFDDPARYFATLAHELGHWTGHRTRLARGFKGRRGDPEYAKEELVAEFAAAGVLAVNELPGMVLDQHTAYLRSWLKKALREDPEALPRAVTLGQSAADYLTIRAAAPRAAELAARSLADRDHVAVYFDRVAVGPNPVLVAIGVDADGFRTLLGAGSAAQGEDADKEEQCARTLLADLVNRGLPAGRTRLFVTSRPATLGSAIRAVFGETSFLQRCRSTVVRDVVAALRAEDSPDGSPERGGESEEDGSVPVSPDVVRDRIRDAVGSGLEAGPRELETLAGELEGHGASGSAQTLRDCLPDLFAVDVLGLEPPLARTLSTTYSIRQARFGLSGQICRPPTWRDEGMALHWAAASFADTVEQRRRIPGYWKLRGLRTIH